MVVAAIDCLLSAYLFTPAGRGCTVVGGIRLCEECQIFAAAHLLFIQSVTGRNSNNNNYYYTGVVMVWPLRELV